MFGYTQYNKVVACTMATGDTYCAPINIAGANRISFIIPTCSIGLATATANVYVQINTTSTTSSFKRVLVNAVASGTTGGWNTWEIPSTTGNVVISDVPALGFDWARIQFNNTCTTTFTPYMVIHH